MKANELRIGNWIRIEGIETRVYIPDLDYIDQIGGVKNVEPIPLIEEWLEKGELPEWIRIQIIGDEVNGDFFVVDIRGKHPDGDYIWQRLPRIYYYLHQLQNLVFALTGKELELTKEL